MKSEQSERRQGDEIKEEAKNNYVAESPDAPDEKMKILINKDGVKEYGTEQDEAQEEEEQGEYGASDYSRL